MSKRIKTTINHNGSSNNCACVPVVVLCNWEELHRLGDAIAQSTCAQLHRTTNVPNCTGHMQNFDLSLKCKATY